MSCWDTGYSVLHTLGEGEINSNSVINPNFLICLYYHCARNFGKQLIFQANKTNFMAGKWYMCCYHDQLNYTVKLIDVGLILHKNKLSSPLIFYLSNSFHLGSSPFFLPPTCHCQPHSVVMSLFSSFLHLKTLT